MSGSIDKRYLDQQLPAIIEEHIKQNKLDPHEMPSWQYIDKIAQHSAQGLHNNCEKYFNKSLHDHLRDKGFGLQASGDWPTNDDETIKSLIFYVKVLREQLDRADSTIDTAICAINKIYEAISSQDKHKELIELARYEEEQERLDKIQYTAEIISYIRNQVGEAASANYSHYFDEYYKLIDNKFIINFNPVKQALDQFDFDRPEGDPNKIKPEQLRALWETLDKLNHSLVEGYTCKEWKMFMKMLILLLVAIGPRSSEVVDLDMRSQFRFGSDPHVVFHNRKNLNKNEGPVDVPIMTGSNILQAYRDYIDKVYDSGAVVPSSRSASGCRTTGTLNDWLQRLCQLAEVRLEDGSLPTMKNFRQFWTSRYNKAVHQNRKEIALVSEEKGTSNPLVDEDSYIGDKQIRRHIRDLGREYFDEVLNIDGLPTLVNQELTTANYIDYQTNLSSY
jgi:integrase